MEERGLVTTEQMSLEDTMTLGRVLATSGRFSDTSSAEQAVVKVLAGRELGFGPIASMVGIYIIKGRVSISANLMAQAVKRSTKYNYVVAEMSAERCEIVFFEAGKELGRSVFNKEDAKKAGTQNIDKFPRNMLFARAMSNGVKWFCPDVFQTGVYTPEELGIPVDGDGEMIDVTPTPAELATDELFGEYQHEGANTPSKPAHWIESDKVRARFWAYTTELTLSKDDVHAALGVEHVKDFEGTMQDAKAAIQAYISTKIAEADDKEAQEPPMEELDF